MFVLNTRKNTSSFRIKQINIIHIPIEIINISYFTRMIRVKYENRFGIQGIRV